MPVTKRTRYEVLKRDNHACRYCGASAPEAPLTVDHVTPVALGGSDDPTNLVAACRDCNAGKSSAAPDSGLVADVREDALRHAELTRQAYDVLVARMGDRDDYLEEFHDTWMAWGGGSMPVDWPDSVARWFRMGVPIELVVDAAERACRKSHVSGRTGRFTYMCGIVWGQVQTVTEAAEDHRAIAGSFMTEEALDALRMQGAREGWDAARWHALRTDPVSVVVDKIDYETTA